MHIKTAARVLAVLAAAAWSARAADDNNRPRPEGQAPIQTPAAKPGSNASARAPMTAEQLIAKIHAANLKEIKLGELGLQRGDSARVRRYGLLLSRDHKLGDRRTLDLAKAQDIPVAAYEPSQDPDVKAALAHLQGTQGKDFDLAFLKHMEEGHRNVLSLLAEARGANPDPGMAELIDKLRPILEQHAKLAGRLQGRS